MKPSKRPFSDLVDVDHIVARPAKRRVVEKPSPSNSHAPKTSSPHPQLPYPSTASSRAPTKPIPFQQPLSLITFSYSPERILQFSDTARKYFVPPPRSADLRYGYERWVKRPEEKGRLDGLLRGVLKIRDRIDGSGPSAGMEMKMGAKWLSEIGVVSWRGVMTKIMTAPYEERDGWEMNVMRVGNALYFEEHLSDAKLAEKTNLTPHHRLQSYYGYSFESWCTSSHPHYPDTLPGHPPGWSGDVDTNVQWCSVVKTKLGDTRIVIGGEVDCVRPSGRSGPVLGDGGSDASADTNTFVELKTSLVIRGPQDEARFEKKMLKFYFQSFLLGVPEILVGFRTPQGELRTTQTFKTIEIPRLVRGKQGAWDPGVCLEWGQRFLGFILDAVKQEKEQKEEAHRKVNGEDERTRDTRREGESEAQVESGTEDPESSDHDRKDSDDGDVKQELDHGLEKEGSKPVTPPPEQGAKRKPKAKVWRVRFTPRTGVTMSLLDEQEVEVVEAGEDRIGFLPQWYWDAVHP